MPLFCFILINLWIYFKVLRRQCCLVKRRPFPKWCLSPFLSTFLVSQEASSILYKRDFCSEDYPCTSSNYFQREKKKFLINITPHILREIADRSKMCANYAKLHSSSKKCKLHSKWRNLPTWGITIFDDHKSKPTIFLQKWEICQSIQ